MYAHVTIDNRQVIFDHPSVCIRWAKLLAQNTDKPVILSIFWALGTKQYRYLPAGQ